ncbi:hypothetical protein F0562_030725 [Nyssa sinensis]|uniref:HMA domain-containing protein n=1 Tax=Nyssa sinensis TaxID=561372 RepID=A0A5J5B1E9_9ASTE|nr:hypothetical protein F0562_030725 [Nyssa sinensis]
MSSLRELVLQRGFGAPLGKSLRGYALESNELSVLQLVMHYLYCRPSLSDSLLSVPNFLSCFHAVPQKIELKVNIWCQKCKTDVLEAVTKLRGIDQVSVNSEKGMLTVIGEVDPVLVATRVKKKRKEAEIISVGPPKPPTEPPKKPPAETPPQQKKPQEKPLEKPRENPLPPCCNKCQIVTIYKFYDDGYCNIL